MTDSNVTGIAKAARKIPITASLQSHEASDGKKTRVKYLLGCERIAPPFFACTQSFFSWRQKMRPRTHEQEGAADDDDDRGHRVGGDVAEVLVERAGHREEEVEVDERPGDREEDLLDEVGGERAGERAARDDRDEHQQRHERADVRRQEAVHRHADGVGGDDRRELDLAGIGGARMP